LLGGTIMPKLDKVIEVREGSSTTENFYALQLAANVPPNSEIIFETNQKTLYKMFTSIKLEKRHK
jgi:hypothetical protein